MKGMRPCGCSRRSGDLRAAAAGFFEALHELDALELERIDAQPLSEQRARFGDHGPASARRRKPKRLTVAMRYADKNRRRDHDAEF